MAFLDQKRGALLDKSVLRDPQRNSSLSDTCGAFLLKANVNFKLDQGLEAFLRLVETVGNHIGRDDEELGVGVLRTPSERVAIERPHRWTSPWMPRSMPTT